MKKMVFVFLTLSFLLSGCGLLGQRMQEPVSFCYLREDPATYYSEGVVGWEEREASGHRNNLSYLLALYLMGPSSEDLRSPIPLGTYVFKAEVQEDGVYLKLSDTKDTISDSQFSLACACLSLTCMELTGENAVTIHSGDRAVTMTRDNLILFDNSGVAATEESQ